jgi:hypothetical protein
VSKIGGDRGIRPQIADASRDELAAQWGQATWFGRCLCGWLLVVAGLA